MCISRPGQVTGLEGPMALVRNGDHTGWFNALPVPGLRVGAWVFTQSNLVVAEVTEEAAREALSAAADIEAMIALDQPGRER